MSNIHYERILDCQSLHRYSPDPSTQVGAKLYAHTKSGFPSSDSCIAWAWNSFPDSYTGSLEAYKDRDLKYDRMIHAEMRCLLIAGKQYGKTLTLYTSMAPCHHCAKHIAEASVARVYYPSSCLQSDFAQRQAASVALGKLLLQECGVEIVELEGI